MTAMESGRLGCERQQQDGPGRGRDGAVGEGLERGGVDGAVDSGATQDGSGRGRWRKTCSCDKTIRGKDPSQGQMSRGGVTVRKQDRRSGKHQAGCLACNARAGRVSRLPRDTCRGNGTPGVGVPLNLSRQGRDTSGSPLILPPSKHRQQCRELRKDSGI